MIVVSDTIGAGGAGGSTPATVSGTGTAPKTFAPQLNMPGSLREDGQPLTIRASGNIVAGVSSTAQFTIFANYPSGQYPVANVTNAVGNTTGGGNVALYNANNNFVLGQYVTVANVASLNGLVGPLIVANSTAFAGQINSANVANVAAANVVGTATIAPQPMYNGVASPALNVGQVVPWMAEVRCIGVQAANLVTAYGTDQIVNFNVTNNGPNIWQAVTSTGLINPVAGVNMKAEPPLYFTSAWTFGSSNANNSAVMQCFYLED
jgi:hypothetical protein